MAGRAPQLGSFYSPGGDHMNGFQALCYVRMREASSDFGRLRREQGVARVMSTHFIAVKPKREIYWPR
jgi:anionic cell wall polymer biosynthesis LytR-Cps2A-Psr (LCP) family protein